MFLKKLKISYNNLTNSEKIIADYITDNANQLKTITSYKLANDLKVGQSTIIRFSQKLGYGSFRELLSDLATATPEDNNSDEIEIEESTDTTNRKIISQYQDIVNLTYSINSAESVDKAVNAIKTANQIIVYGIGNSNLFAEYLSAQLLNIGLKVHCGNNSHIIYSLVSHFSPQDLVILISESGETKEIVKTAKIASKNGTPIIAMTKGTKNKLHLLADVILRSVDYLANTRLNETTVRCSQLCLIDMIYLNLFKTDFNHYYGLFSESEKLLEYKYLGRNKRKTKKSLQME